MALTLTSPPAIEPVTLDELKTHLSGVASSDTDAMLNAFITSARTHVENFLNRVLITQTWEWRLDGFYVWTLGAPKAPLQSVSSITYVDGSGDTQTLASTEYTVDAKSDPGRIQPAYGKTWPVTRPQMNAATVTLVAGYGSSASSVPGPIRDAIKMIATELFTNRQESISGTIISSVPLAAKHLLGPYVNLEFCR